MKKIKHSVSLISKKGKTIDFVMTDAVRIWSSYQLDLEIHYSVLVLFTG